ncbi:glycosyltransferase family 2 protein [Paenibacillus sp. GCM10023252]|uniref:glycosyltransferase family 2 protein n=1 Tax=Paenibacillus sp. GCM10023252 TaxID=3252649 RepID=UPI00361BC6EF
MRLTSIIIPTYNGLQLLQQAVASIRQYTDPISTPYEIIVVDNGGSDQTAEWCRQQRMMVIAMSRNEGFPSACNRGLRMSRGDSLLLLNNDVTVTKSWLSNLLAALYSSDLIGMVGPTTNYASGKQQVEVTFSNLQEFAEIAAAVNQSQPEQWEAATRLIGFCLLFKRELYDRIGDLDERFSPGHYEDDDYCLRARMNGYQLRICRDVLVHHLGSASFKRQAPLELERLVETNRQRYIDKWSIDPAVFMT